VPNPWIVVAQTLPPGTCLPAVVTEVAAVGTFVAPLAHPDLEGLLQQAHGMVVGQGVDVTVDRVDALRGRLYLRPPED
jgi:ribosomal protein S1